ncbi:MAG: aspartate aminotransferase family protein [Actinomycetota bacterium]|jgi:4-aminobutyrate aminotransferase|nr:aspartate aminotransferase family protein [Rubrobacter sp.]MBA3789742.1 aspartate aminotransferase family protein [Rubrobacter sp.]MDQ3235904.1 aspartate aminotransferase family protein [Actinomycetota bacterium]MDQ3567748.1 aspartate aminotransferase family protein [Actinomycetota bacterium]
MNPEELAARHRAVLPEWISLNYERPVELVRGEGFRVWDSEGNEYLDFFGGIVTTISGHAVPEISEAVKAQADKIFHSSTLYLIENQVKLAEKLVELAPISGDKKVFFVGSGSEANEAALLFATHYRGSSEIIALRGSYHGGSFGTMGITGQGSWRATPRSALDVSYAMTPHRSYSPIYRQFEDAEEFARACAEDVRNLIETSTTGHVAAFIAEPIQGVGGFIELPPAYLSRVKEILDEHGILFISDEVQTAFGRTGSHFWGIEQSGVEPDLVTMAKGLGNGLSIGAVMGRADIVDSLSPKLHISTFGGNHVSSAGALANIEFILENDLQRNADEVGGYLKDRLVKMSERNPMAGEVRGRGLMLAIELTGPDGEPDPRAAARFMEACRERGVLVGKGGLKANTIRISPPLTITHEAATQAANVFEEALAEVGTREKVG